MCSSWTHPSFFRRQCTVCTPLHNLWPCPFCKSPSPALPCQDKLSATLLFIAANTALDASISFGASRLISQAAYGLPSSRPTPALPHPSGPCRMTSGTADRFRGHVFGTVQHDLGVKADSMGSRAEDAAESGKMREHMSSTHPGVRRQYSTGCSIECSMAFEPGGT